MASTTTFVFLLLSSLALFCPSLSDARTVDPPFVDGLSKYFYDGCRVLLEDIVRDGVNAEMKKEIEMKKDPGVAAGLIRIFFNDCFVQGCDASVLLTGTNSEQHAAPNKNLRPEALELINIIHKRANKACKNRVSCADIIALAARDSVDLSGGPKYEIELGRRDSLAPAALDVTTADLPDPRSNVGDLISLFAKNDLNKIDLVALSGAHTVGQAHCDAFRNRLQNDSTINPEFAKKLLKECPNDNVNNVQPLDIRTPNGFDNSYYVDLMKKEGLFTSDEGLYFNELTKDHVEKFAKDQKEFFTHFGESMIKMSRLHVLTGNEGQIRVDCTSAN